MADRKISELSEAASVASGDYIVVVTGVGVGGATLTTNRFPLSGLIADVINIEELVLQGTGIHLVNVQSDDGPNTVTVNVSGYAYSDHEHVAADISDFSSAVSGEVQQIIKVQSTDIANTGSDLLESSDLTISLAANSKYLCQLGTILNMNENTDLEGLIAVTGDMEVNYPTKIYGTWNHLEVDNQGHGTVHNENTAITGYGLLIDSIGTDGLGENYTIVNSFVVETTNNEADTITFGFTTTSTNQATSGVLKEGSWLKAEKVL